MAVRFHLLGELAEAVPFRLSIRFDGLGVILLLRVFVRAFVEQLRVHFHEELHRVVDHAVDCPNSSQLENALADIADAIPIPVTLRVLVKRREHDWQDHINIVADQITEVLVVPKVKRSLGDLYVVTISKYPTVLEYLTLTWKCGLATLFAS